VKILFFAPFKPLHHPSPSGDQAIGRGLLAFLASRGHQLQLASDVRLRWIPWRPWLWPAVAVAARRALRLARRWRPDLWLTYHAYYKAPDLLGPAVCRACALPYAVFQGAFATRYRRHWHTRPGYELNRRALLAADHVFANKRVDWVNLRRLLPARRVSYVAPGLPLAGFGPDVAAGSALRRRWGLEHVPVLLTAAMLRADVKSESLAWLFRALEGLCRRVPGFRLMVAGDGPRRNSLERLARRHLADRVRFLGCMPRQEMAAFYSAGDLFVYPGIGESLGMVFLEAQACGLPVVAFDTGGIPEVVRAGETGLLTPARAVDPFVAAVERLLTNAQHRIAMGAAAQRYIASHHDLEHTYVQVDATLGALARRERR
jgi:glycosyltransferase involved in cell wall biosynthesis